VWTVEITLSGGVVDSLSQSGVGAGGVWNGEIGSTFSTGGVAGFVVMAVTVTGWPHIGHLE
jgi:hypothetical protein